MCDNICKDVYSCAKDHLLPLASDHLLPILKESVNMIRGVPLEIARMKHQLEKIEEFISIADRVADAEENNKSHGTRGITKELIEASFHIEDVIDEYMIREEQQLPDPGCADFAANYVKTMFLRLQIAYKIQNIKSRIDEIKETSSEKDDGFPQIQSSWEQGPSSSDVLYSLRSAPFHIDDADVVGFEEPKKILFDWLVEGRTERTVVSVVAMGGQGKTTLAKNVFDRNNVIKHFDCRVWITVSQSYNAEGLLKKMLQKLYKLNGQDPPQSIDQMDRGALVDEVKNCLQQKRYVVVFDDVWNIRFWDEIEFAMIDNKNGSKILITTRNMDVVNACKKSSYVEVHKLKPLTKEKSLELFNKKAFHNLEGCCPENLIDISSKIIEKCNGLPLAIVIIGGLLSCKDRKPIEWYKFSENINPKLKEDSKIKKILALSYHDLPYNLKSCFLSFGLYPEDFIVPSNLLTRQWMAEGFIKEDIGRTSEEVAEEYLTELIRRNLVQVVSISIDGRAKSCRVHDLVHAMIVEKCEDLSFCKNIFEDKQSSLTGMIRRLAIRTTDSDNLMKNTENSHVRSLLVHTSKTLPETFRKKIPTKYKYLKVLDFEHDDQFLEVPNDLGSLSYLKYFGFRVMADQRFQLPKSIGKLENLETLDLRFSNKMEIKVPKEICKLRKLRHLLGNKMSLILLKEGIGDMKTLQTLSEVYLNEDEDEKDNRVVELIQELGKLKQLRKLVLRGLKSKYMSVISSSINDMQQLEKLRIGDIQWNNTPIDMHLNSPPPMLQFLSLRGKLEKLPEWISKLQNLVKLKLRDSILRYDDIMKLLESLPNLLSLTLHGCHYENEFERLHFQVGSFKSLKELFLYDLFSLNYIVFDEGALPSLKQLSIMLQLKTLPTGIQHLKKLEVLSFYDNYGMEITAEEYNNIIGGSELDIIHYSNFEKKEKW